MSTKHEMLCEQRIWNSNNKINKMIKVVISIKSIPTCFISTFKCVAVTILVMVLKKLYYFKFKFRSKRTSSIYFPAILCKFYLIIVSNLKAKCTINNFRMFMFDSNSLQNKKIVRDLVFQNFIKMASRSVLLGSLTSRIKGDHAY